MNNQYQKDFGLQSRDDAELVIKSEISKTTNEENLRFEVWPEENISFFGLRRYHCLDANLNVSPQAFELANSKGLNITIMGCHLLYPGEWAMLSNQIFGQHVKLDNASTPTEAARRALSLCRSKLQKITETLYPASFEKQECSICNSTGLFLDGPALDPTPCICKFYNTDTNMEEAKPSPHNFKT